MIPLTILSLLAIFFGYIGRDMFVGMGSDFLSPSLFTHPSHITLMEAEFGLSLGIKLLPAIGTLAGAGLALYLYHVAPLFTIALTNSPTGQKLYRFFNGKYFVDVIYNHYFINGGLQFGYTVSKTLDRGIIELVGPHGLSSSLTTSSKTISKQDNGSVTSYALYILLGQIIITLVVFAPILFQSTSDVMSISMIQVLLVSVGIILLLDTKNTSSH